MIKLPSLNNDEFLPYVRILFSDMANQRYMWLVLLNARARPAGVFIDLKNKVVRSPFKFRVTENLIVDCGDSVGIIRAELQECLVHDVMSFPVVNPMSRTDFEDWSLWKSDEMGEITMMRRQEKDGECQFIYDPNYFARCATDQHICTNTLWEIPNGFLWQSSEEEYMAMVLAGENIQRMTGHDKLTVG